MSKTPFVIIGENIHCTRIYKRDGKFARTLDNGSAVIFYKAGGEERQLPVPEVFTSSDDWENGKVRHCAVAVWQGMNGDEAARAAGVDYLHSMAKRQERAGAAFLDINLDEFSTDTDEKTRAMTWTVGVVQQATALPMSIDSSSPEVLRVGLAACDRARGKPMINSVSLERLDAVALAAEFDAAVVASAAGKSGLPSTTEEKLANISELMPHLASAGIDKNATYIDPLVLPISTDPANGSGFLGAVSAMRQAYGADIHITGGFSNVSFGMPKRKLINQVFTYLAVEAGADSGIVDPTHINAAVLDGIDTDSEAFGLAKALLTGEDDFGMNFIMASREGRL